MPLFGNRAHTVGVWISAVVPLPNEEAPLSLPSNARLNYKLPSMKVSWRIVSAIGVGVAVAAALFAYSIYRGMWSYPPVSSLRGGWFYEYQSFVGGLLALIGIAVSVFYLSWQIREARDQRRIATADANRSLMERLERLQEQCDWIAERARALMRQGFMERGYWDGVETPPLNIPPQLEHFGYLANLRTEIIIAFHAVVNYRAGLGRVDPTDQELVGGIRRSARRLRSRAGHLIRLLGNGVTVEEILSFTEPEIERGGPSVTQEHLDTSKNLALSGST